MVTLFAGICNGENVTCVTSISFDLRNLANNAFAGSPIVVPVNDDA
jgi:hypothetical protein